MDRLDEEKLEILRAWGEGLLNDGRDELRAAGRAILRLAEEIEYCTSTFGTLANTLPRTRRCSKLSPWSPGGSLVWAFSDGSVLFAIVVCRAHPMSNKFSTARLTAGKPLARTMH
jgi:hypothetical protein